jgi:hypothetical protein
MSESGYPTDGNRKWTGFESRGWHYSTSRALTGTAEHNVASPSTFPSFRCSRR